MSAPGARTPLRDAEISLFVLDEFTAGARRPVGRVLMLPGADDQARMMTGERWECATATNPSRRARRKAFPFWIPLGRRADGTVAKRELPLYVADEQEIERDAEVREAENEEKSRYTIDDESPQVWGWASAV